MDDGEPAPATRADHDDRDRDEHGPRHVHRRHGRELVGNPAAEGPVHRLAVPQTGVDEPEPRHHAGRSHRDHLHEEAGSRGDRDRVAHARVGVAMPRVQPDEERDGDREMQARVVQIAELHHGRMRQHGPLHRHLVGEMQRALQPPHPVRVGHRALHPCDRELRGPLPQREQTEHDRGLARESPGHAGRPAPGPQQHERADPEDERDQCGRLPRDPEARHPHSLPPPPRPAPNPPASWRQFTRILRVD